MGGWITKIQERIILFHFSEGVSCGGRRKALEALKQGNPAAAVKILHDVERYYLMTVEPEGLQ